MSVHCVTGYRCGCLGRNLVTLVAGPSPVSVPGAPRVLGIFEGVCVLLSARIAE